MSLNDFLSKAGFLPELSLRGGGRRRFAGIGVAVAIAIVSNAIEVAAQVTEDQNLGSENTRVEFDNGTYEIRGGATRGARDELLFHSFDSFSVGTGQTAEFVNDDSISTIFSRVTGEKLSQIDGTISAGGTADLFLLNPAGIVFGPSASIDIGGSALISTAESLIFANGGEFSSRNPQPVPLLTISQPIGLQSVGPGPIEPQPIALQPIELQLGNAAGGIEINEAFLFLNLDKTALFAGNGITLTGGGLIIPSGRAELVSLAPGSSLELVSSEESLVSRFDVDSENFTQFNFSNLDLLGGGFVDTSSAIGNLDSAGGRIVLAGQQVQLESGEVFSENSGRFPGENVSILASARVDISGSTVSTDAFATGNGGNLLIEVNGPLSLLNGSKLLSQSRPSATGAAGTLTIRAQQLTVRGGSEVSTSALGDGLGGNLFVDVPGGTVEITGALPTNDRHRISLLISNTEGTQAAGEIQIAAENLLVRSGGQIDATARASGDSQGITINATQSVVVSGRVNNVSSAITSSNSGESTGNAGPIDLTTKRLLIADGGQIFTSTNGPGQGGDLSVQAEEIILSGSGTSEDKLFGLFARTEGTGDSGRLEVTTESLLIRDGARLSVSTDEDASTDNLGTVREATITARQVVLDSGRITAESLSGNGGILDFDIRDFLLLRNNSFISATAGTAAAGGDGGNINIMMPTGFVVAVPGENSDIIANAFSGTGGNITIATQNILGLAAGPAIADNSTNDIDASSEFGTAGTILFNNLELDPTAGIIELPTDTVSPGQVAQRCLADSDGRNTFVITGQGGAPPSPINVVRNERLSLGPTVDQSFSGSPASSLATVSIVEASGWQRNPAGSIVLVAPDSVTARGNSTHYHSCIDGQNVVQQSG